MTADEIRKVNELCQRMSLETKTVAEREAGLQSLLCTLLAEIAAQMAEGNESMKRLAYPMMVVENKTTEGESR